MIIEELKIEEIKPYKNNPRKETQKSLDVVKKSIEDYGMNVPIVIDNNNIVVCGHIRLEACKQLNFKKIPCVRLSNLTEEQIKAYRLVDNRTAEFYNWDVIKLQEELKNLNLSKNYNFDEILEEIEKEDINPYTQKIEIEEYRQTNGEGGASKVYKKEDFKLLYNNDKFIELNEKINKLDTDDDTKEFLKAAATRFYDFNFKNIAEFYAMSTKEIQGIMEELALVIIDYNKALELGFIKLNNKILDLMEKESQWEE